MYDRLTSWLHARGAEFALPIDGAILVDVVIDGVPTLIFSNRMESRITIFGPFRLRVSTDDREWNPRDGASHALIFSLLEDRLKEAKSDRTGVLSIHFDDGTLIEIPDGPFENWTYRDTQKREAHGGVGRLVF